MAESLPSRGRERTPSYPILLQNCLVSETALSSLLSVKLDSFEEAQSLKDHGREIKYHLNSFLSNSKNLSNYLKVKGSSKERSDIISQRHDIRSDCSDMITVINEMLEDSNIDCLSEIDNRSVCSSMSSSVATVVRPESIHEQNVSYQHSRDIIVSRPAVDPEPEVSNVPNDENIISLERMSLSSEEVYNTPKINSSSQIHRLKHSFSRPMSPVNQEMNLLRKNLDTCNWVDNNKEESYVYPNRKNVNFTSHQLYNEINHKNYTSTSNKAQQIHPVKSTVGRALDRGQSYRTNQDSYRSHYGGDRFDGMPNDVPEIQSTPNFHDRNFQQCSDNIQIILAKQLLTKDLIKNSIEAFDGTSYKFWSWIQQITSRVKSLSLTPNEYVQVLESNSTGGPKKLIMDFMSSCGNIDNSKADEIFNILADRYGSDGKIARDLLSKIKNFPPIKSNNMIKPLRDLLDLCRLVEFNMRNAPDLQFMNISSGAELVREKLPIYVQDRWRITGQNHEDSHGGQHPPFQVLIEFLNKICREISNTNYTTLTSTNVHASDRKNHTVLVTTEESSPSESYCYLHKVDNHDTMDCKKFSKLLYNEKKKIILADRLCYLCLKQHMMKDCKTSVKCEKCPEKHCTAMHRSAPYNKENSSPVSNQKPAVQSMCTTLRGSDGFTKSCSKTLLVDIKMKNIPKKRLRCYAIIDEMSDCTLVDPKVPEFFEKEFPKQEYSLSTLNGCKIATEGMVVTGLTIKGVTEKEVIHLPPALSNASIPDTKHEVATPNEIRKISTISKYASRFSYLDDEAEVLILLGRDCQEAMRTQCHSDVAPWIHHTALGWAAVGNTCGSKHDNKIRTVLRTSVTHEHFSVKKDFPSEASKLKEIKLDVFKESNDDMSDGLSCEDEKFLSLMNKNITVSKDNNLVVPLPFKCDEQIPSNQQAVFNRTRNTLHRLKLQSDKISQCIKSMGKSIDAGHIELVPESELNAKPGSTYWLPIFPVTHSKKDKVRLVFDASAKYNGFSLNDKLLKGPDFNNQLRGVLLRFREGIVGFIADIEHMFNNFKVTDQDKDYLRFYWFEDNSPEKKLVQYRSTTHVFGCTSSPAVSNFCLRYSAREVKDKIQAKKYIENSFYVDDGLSSCNSASEAITVVKDAVSILSRFNIRLHKILSSSSKVLLAFPETERATGCHDFKHEEIPSQRTLGVLWNPDKDVFVVEVNIPLREFSKRGILSVINSLFDPLGFIAPVSLAGRLIQREILTAELKTYDWDDKLPEKYRKRWDDWKETLMSVATVQIPRCYIPSIKFLDSKKELQVFTDASEVAIGYVMYMKIVSPDGFTHVSFVYGGSKVAPRTATTIPRLELCAAVEVSIVATNILKELQQDISEVRYYSDSRVVLGYLSNSRRSFSNYVTRRVRIILSNAPRNLWHYVKTKNNPADISSRPQTPKELASSSWFKGPAFLWSNDNSTCAEEEIFNNDELPEERAVQVSLVTGNVQQSLITKMCTQINNWRRILHVVTMLLSLSHNLDIKRQSKGISLAPREQITSHDKAQIRIVRIVQNEMFGEEIRKIKHEGALSDSNELSTLSPFIDNEGLLRVGGRLRNSTIPADCIHPLLLPDKHIVTTIILRHHHEQVNHQGGHITSAEIRTNGFHIIHSKKVVKNMIKNCVVCRKLRGKPMTQLMADLPPDRLEEVPPFSNVGIDVFGPYLIYDGQQTRNRKASKKVWVLICVCLVTRAVHLELLPSMDTSAFRNALSRFVAIRGACKLIRSDNGTNFVSARRQMKDETNVNVAVIQADLKNKNIEWIFNPPGASHCSGAWERKIGGIKRVLDGSMLLLGHRSLSRDEFHTLIQEAAAIVNGTPLWEVSDSPDDPFPLSPSTLLTLKEHPNQPSLDTFTEDDILSYGKRRWRRVQYLVEQFWVRWRRHYIQNMQVRSKWKRKVKNICVGDIVLVKNKVEKRNKWPIAKIIEVIKGKDDLIRSVYLKLPSSKVAFRSIHDVILLVPTQL